MYSYYVNAVKSSRAGFTLIELSIVLAIIALISGAVLIGQVMVRNAELQNTIAQYREFKTAVSTFESKYPGLPGDLRGGRKFGLSTNPAHEYFQDGTSGNGDGNGRITKSGSATQSDEHTGEMAMFWVHLTSAQTAFISGGYDATGATISGVDMPGLKLGNAGWGVYGLGRRENYLVAGLANDNSVATNTTAIFTPTDAYNIDDKIDDGRPLSGKVRALGMSSNTMQEPPLIAQGESDNACVNSAFSPYEYQYTAPYANCVLRFVLTSP